MVHISDGGTPRNSDQTMVAFMQSYRFSEVSQLALVRWQTREEVDQRKKYRTRLLESLCRILIHLAIAL